MKSFDFYFGLCLGERLFCHTDNSSRTLQQTKMSAVSGQRLANLTSEVLQKMRTDGFESFYETVLKKAKSLPVSEPTLPRKRRVPIRFEVGSGSPSYPATHEEHYRRIYFEAFDLIVNAIKERFQQSSFKIYMNMESLLVKAVNKEDYSTELQFLEEEGYNDDVDVGVLVGQLALLSAYFKEVACTCFDDIFRNIQQLSIPVRALINQILTVS